jgi:hypothetical protein
MAGESLCARMRQPSTFSSYTHPSRWKGSGTCAGIIGAYCGIVTLARAPEPLRSKVPQVAGLVDHQFMEQAHGGRRRDQLSADVALLVDVCAGRLGRTPPRRAQLLAASSAARWHEGAPEHRRSTRGCQVSVNLSTDEPPPSLSTTPAH